MKKTGAISPRRRRLLIFLAALLLAVCAALVICRALVLSCGKGAYSLSDIENIQPADFAVVPFTGNDSYHIAERMTHRLDTAVALYNDGRAGAIIVTGHGGEADLSAKYLADAGIPAEDILLDRGGYNLYSSIWRISRAYPEKSLLFCIQEKYIPRSDYIADGLGADLECVAADEGEYDYKLYENAREVLASAKAVLEAGLFRPAPLLSLEASPIVSYPEALAGK